MSVEDRIKTLETTVEELTRRVASLEADSKVPKATSNGSGRRPSQGRNVTSTPGRNAGSRKSYASSGSVTATPGKTAFARSPNLPPSTPQARKSSITNPGGTPSRALPGAVSHRLQSKPTAHASATKASTKEFYFIAGHKVYVEKLPAFKDYKGEPGPPKADLRMHHAYGYNGKGTYNSLFFSAEDELVYPLAGTGVVYNATSHQQRFFTEHDEDITALTVNHARTLAATGQRDPKGKLGPYVCVWEIKTCKLIVKISYHEHGIAGLCFSPDDKYLVSFGEGDSRFGAIWDWAAEAKKKDVKREPVTKFSAPKEKVLSIHSSLPELAEEVKDGSWYFTSVGEKAMKIWKVTPQKATSQPTGSKPKDAFSVTGVLASTYKQTKEIQKAYLSICYLPGGLSVVGCYSGHAYVMQGEKLLKSIQVTKPNVSVGAVVAIPDGFVTASSDGVIRRFSSDLKKNGPVSQFESFPGKPQFQAGDYKDGKLVFGSRDSSIFTIDLAEFANLTQVMVGHRDEIKALAVNPVTPQFASGGWDKTVRFWDFSTRVYGDEILLKRQIYSLAWSRDGTTLAYGTKEGTVGLIQDGKLKGEDKKVGTQMINALQYTPDDKEIVCGCDDNVLYFIDATNLKLLKKGAAHSSAITHLSISSDGKVVATNSRDYQIMYWNAANGKRLLTDYPVDIAYDPWTCLLGWPVQGIWHESENGSDVNAVAISGKPEAQLAPGKGALVVSGDDFGQVNLYSYPVIQKKPPVKKYRGHSAHIYSLSFTPNDRYLITSGAGDLALIQWRVKQPGQPEEDPEEVHAASGDAHGDTHAESEEKGHAEEQPATEEQGGAEEQPTEEAGATEEQPAGTEEAGTTEETAGTEEAGTEEVAGDGDGGDQATEEATE